MYIKQKHSLVAYVSNMAICSSVKSELQLPRNPLSTAISLDSREVANGIWIGSGLPSHTLVLIKRRCLNKVSVIALVSGASTQFKLGVIVIGSIVKWERAKQRVCVCAPASYANHKFAPHFFTVVFSKGADFPLTEYLVEINTCSVGDRTLRWDRRILFVLLLKINKCRCVY